ncbi:signal peptidase I [Halobellus salinisoli]|uniref:signal peptidase I n=1 Tax=Halobellus salinisoli TaxID=3108500 RepID=UPI00300AEB55
MSLRDREDVRRAANVVGLLLLIAAVVPFVVYGAPQVVGADHGFVVLSGSMEPAMSPGDAIIVREASPEEIEERDIITYRTDSDTPTTHRVVDVVEQDGSVAYATKGDANEDADPGSIAHEQVIGEVLFVIPLLGYVVQFVNTTVGFAALVVLPLLLFTLSELRALLRSVDDETNPNEAAADGGQRDAPTPETPDSEKPVAEDEPESGGSITLTRSSLQLLGLVFALYLPYSAYVAYTTRAAWSITVAVATGIALLFVGGLYAGSGGQASTSDEQPATSDEQAAGDGSYDGLADGGSGTDSSVSPKRSVEPDGGERVSHTDGRGDSDGDSARGTSAPEASAVEDAGRPGSGGIDDG